jgi:Ca-activated chloride channel family protein
MERQIVSFSTEDTPISVGLIFDSSGSMSDKIQESREAVAQFFKAYNPQDEFLLINFSEKFKQVPASRRSMRV